MCVFQGCIFIQDLQLLSVMAAWRRRWKRHISVAVTVAVTIFSTLWVSGEVLRMARDRFEELSNQPCRMPFA